MFCTDDGENDVESVVDSDESDDPHDAARLIRARLLRELCEEYKDYDAFTVEETRWALRLIARVDERAFESNVLPFVGRVVPPTHDLNAAAARCVRRIRDLMRDDGVYARLSGSFGRGAAYRLGFRRVETVQFLFACLLVTNAVARDRDLFDVGATRLRDVVDELPDDVVRENVVPNVRMRVDGASIETIAEEAWREVRERLRAIEEDEDEPERVVRRHVGGAVAALVFARRDGFDFEAVGWVPADVPEGTTRTIAARRPPSTAPLETRYPRPAKDAFASRFTTRRANARCTCTRTSLGMVFAWRTPFDTPRNRTRTSPNSSRTTGIATSSSCGTCVTP